MENMKLFFMTFMSFMTFMCAWLFDSRTYAALETSFSTCPSLR